MEKTEKEVDRYILSCCTFNVDDKNNYFSKTDHELNNIYCISEHDNYEFDPKFHVHIVPFTDNFENAEYFVTGYAKDEEYGKVIELDKHINNLVKRVGELGEYKIECENDLNKKMMNENDLKKIDNINSKSRKKELILESLSTEMNYEYIDQIRGKLSLISVNPDPLFTELKTYCLPEIEDAKYIDYFRLVCDAIIKISKITDKKLIYAWAINKYVEEVSQ